MKKKLLIFFLGFLLLLVLSELGLRLISFINPLSVTSSSKKTQEKTILCLGNSFTLGTGAPLGQSYPDYLQTILNANHPSKFHVVNGGRGVLNTTILIHMLPTLLKEHSPDLVVLQIGQANTFNYSQYQDYLKRIEQVPPHANWFYQLYDKCHTLRLIHYLWSNHKNQRKLKRLTFSLHPQNDEKDFRHEYASSEVFREWNPSQVKEQMSKIEKRISEGKGTYQYFAMLGDIYWIKLQNKEKAFETYIRGILWDPYYWKNSNFERIQRLANQVQDNQLKSKIENFKKEFSLRNNEEAQGFFDLSDNEISKWVIFDLNQIHKILNQSKIPFIILNYPPLITDYYSPTSGNVIVSKYYINDLIRNFAQTNAIPFYDLENSIWKYWQAGEKEKFFSFYSKIMNHYDYHLNSSGYKLNAEELYQTIMQNPDLKKIISN